MGSIGGNDGGQAAIDINRDRNIHVYLKSKSPADWQGFFCVNKEIT